MQTKLTIYERIEKFLDKSKIPTAYVLFIYITSVQYIPDNWVSEDFKNVSLWPVAITLGIIILRIFFDIYKKINEPKKTLPFYNKWGDLIDSGEFLKIFKKRLHDDKVLNIKIIGISLRFHWSYIKNLMEEYLLQDKNVEFNISLSMLDTDAYDSLEFIDESFKQKFLIQAQATENDIELFKKNYEKQNRTSKCNITLHKYTFMPSFYGILLDDKFLFLGNTYWGKDMIRSAGQSYNLYVEDDDFSGSERIKIFNSWLNYIENKSKSK
ncbi:hypothetical protein HNV08_09100 [Winogradskyella eckloniae]|uniref:hypothetical protein n=1 Tax=Winogradskyella eckloniae TaxID=1089306 RepID=UPI001563E7AD|nr:hypothetical protein [Winogradskyella eckloniae]NRD20206.1 hypothetical protein [Winogradskyella eckloniae]